jgi:hypothetical protein
MQYLLMIYRSEAELGKMDPAARQKMSAEYGTFTQSIIQSGNFKADGDHGPRTRWQDPHDRWPVCGNA